VPRYANKVDENQAEVVAALRSIGCSVDIIGLPVDLLVGYRAHNFLIEVKQPGEKPRTKKQKDFLAGWRGQVRVVETPEEAIDLVTRAYRGPA
jgi:hypothetical protein